MIKGECIKQVVYFVPENPTTQLPALDLPASSTSDCCSSFLLNVFGHLPDADPYKNDYYRVIKWFNDTINSATITLHKLKDGFVQVAVLSGSPAYGVDYPFNHFTNERDEIFIGYHIDFRKILLDVNLGEGIYFARVQATDVFGATYSYDTPQFCLNHYSALLADGTVKIEYTISGQMGDIEDDTKVKDFGELLVTNMLRLPGYFGYPKSTYEETRNIYENGQRKYVTDRQQESLKLFIEPVPAFVHRVLRTDVMQADQIKITDYNTNNAEPWVQKRVYKKSSYEPQWKDLQTKLAPVELEFEPEFNRHQKYF